MALNSCRTSIFAGSLWLASLGFHAAAGEQLDRPDRDQLHFTAQSLPCGLKLATAPVRFARLKDGATLVAESGQRLTLDNLVLPLKPLSLSHLKTWRAERSAIAKLRQLIEDAPLRIASHSRDHTPNGKSSKLEDRYGRLPRHIFIEKNGRLHWLQAELVRQGLARAAAGAGSSQCLDPLLALENAARRELRGIWRDRFYQVARAGNEGQLLKRRHSFQIVQGKVQSVAEVGPTTYINFGSDWRRDFTIAVPKSAVKKPPALEKAETENRKSAPRSPLTNLKGSTIRVRGWIERRNGPLIRVTSLAEIEVLDHEEE